MATRELATVTVSGAGQVLRTATRPGLSPAAEVRAAAVAAATVGADPRRAVLDAQLAILDRLLAQARGA